MSTINKSFDVKNGISVANTIIIDGSRNLTNIATFNVTTINVSSNIALGNLAITQNIAAGNLSIATLANAATLNVSGNIANAGNVLVTQNLYSGNISTTNVAVTQNITTGNLSVTQNASAGNLSVTQNLSAGNGNFAGAVTIGGNLIVNGTTVTINATSVQTNDQYIILASNNFADTLDVGFAALSKNTAQLNVYSGLIRHAADEVWHLFEGYALMNAYPATINTAQTNVATLNANVIAQQVIIGGVNVAAQLLSVANTVAFYQNGTLTLAGANLNFNNSSSLNVLATANGTGQINVQFAVNSTALGASVYQADVLAYGTIVLANANLNYINTTSVNAFVTANGTTQANISFAVNTSMNLVSLNVSGSISNVNNILVTQNVNSGNVVVSQNTITGNLSVTQNAAAGNLSVVTLANIASLNAVTATHQTLTVTQNTSTGNLVVTQNVSAGNISVSANATVGNVSAANTALTGSLTVNGLNINTVSQTIATVSQTPLDNFASTGTYATAEYLVQANCQSSFYTTKIVVVTDGVNVYMDEYATILTNGPVGTITAAIATGNVQLLFTANNATSTVVRTARYALAV